MEVKTLSASQIKAEALRLGFSACGMAPAEPVNTAIADAFSRWQAQGMQANMNYMGNYLDKRLDPRLLMEGVRTILSQLLSCPAITGRPIPVCLVRLWQRLSRLDKNQTDRVAGIHFRTLSPTLAKPCVL